jgi:cell division protein FtsQ
MARINVSANPKRKAGPTALPADVRVMNLLAWVLVLAAIVFVGHTVWSFMQRSPLFALRSIEITSPLTRTNAVAVRSVAAPKVAGNFFTIDMAQARAAFEAVPWVRRASVRRVWPNGLQVSIEEHRATAVWDGGENDDRLVNEYGELFDANLADVEDDALPTLAGPEGSSRQVLTLHQRLLPLVAQMDTGIDALRQSRRGSWSLELGNGVSMELGRGSEAGDPAEVVERTARFVRTFTEVSTRLGHPTLQHVDMRHGNGYALRFQGMVMTPTLVPGTSVSAAGARPADRANAKPNSTQARAARN